MKIIKTILHTILEGHDIVFEISHAPLTNEEYNKLYFQFRVFTKTPATERKFLDFVLEKQSFERGS